MPTPEAAIRAGQPAALSPAWQRPIHDVQPAPVLCWPSTEVDRAFHQDGYAVIDGLLTPAEVAELSRNLERYRTYIAPRVPRPDWVRRTANGTISGMYFLERVDPFFAEFGARPHLVAAASRLFQAPMRFEGAESFDKPAGIGPAAVPHQDAVYFRGTGERFMHLWVPLDPADLANGAMLYWGGSHRAGLVEHLPIAGDPDLVGIPDRIVEALEPPRAGVLSPGQLIAHGDLVIHASNPNTSGRGRRAVALVYFRK